MSFSASLARRLLLENGPALVTLCLLAALCWLLARWTWVVLAPAGLAAAPAPPQPPVDLSAARDAVASAGLFSRAGGSRGPDIRVATTLNLKLGGLAAARGEKGSYAVLNLNSKGNEVIGVGAEIAPGIVLHEVAFDHVVIRRQGVLERIDLADAGRKPGAAASFNLGVQKQGSGAYSFSRGELNRTLQNPGQLAQLGALTVQPGVGVKIEQAPEGSLAQKLGLLPGDQISKVNGESVSTQEDLARLYQQFAKAGQVTLEGTRSGTPLQLKYAVQP